MSIHIVRVIFLLFFFFSCAEKEDDNKSNSSTSERYQPSSPITYSADFYASQGLSFSLSAAEILSVAASDYSFELEDSPSWMSIDANSGIISGSPVENNSGASFTIKATHHSQSDDIVSLTRTIAVNGDPLRSYQWHLDNSGQSTFAIKSGTSGFDINVFDVFQMDIFGRGVKVAVSDAGVEINHDDLYENIIENASQNFTIDAPYIGYPTPTSAHGTAVSGIIAARGWNNRGVTGVSPLAQLAGFQFLDSTQSTALLIAQASGEFDIFNFSYGDTLTYDVKSNSIYLAHLKSMSTLARNGKGAIYVKSSGNEFILADNYDSPKYCASHNANFPLENESPYIIIVGAINADGKRASYSSAGSNIWISAPGGEYGIEYPAILTTDLPTCLLGYSKARLGIENDFEFGSSLNQNCHYTSTMNGTSAAAPVISGVIALMLEANPALTQREVKYILAKTAIKVDADSEASPELTHPSTAINSCPNISLAAHAYDLPWLTNSAGFHFHNYYGFGLVDAKAAVDLAMNFSLDSELPLSDAVIINENFTDDNYSKVVDLTIPNNDRNGVTDSMLVSENLIVESVQVQVKVTHELSGEIGIELTAPSGNKSILMNINNSFLISEDSNLDITLTSHAFYGESSSGNWTLKVIDGGNFSSAEGKLDSWRLKIHGRR